jgi:hypothetical protein
MTYAVGVRHVGCLGGQCPPKHLINTLIYEKERRNNQFVVTELPGH